MITGNDLIKIGIKPGPIFQQILLDPKVKDADDLSSEELVAYIRALVPPEVPKVELRSQSLPFSEAVLVENEIEETNLQSVRTRMNELLRTPVIEAGAIMPDTCPAGSETATIPVGGAIAVRNGIIPGAHSADICCSMMATFFLSDLPVGTLLDDLQKSTRFGAGGRHNENLVHHPVLDEEVWNNPFLNGLKSYAVRHMADQGDGNHFAYIGELVKTSETIANLWNNGYHDIARRLNAFSNPIKVLVTHHGSRGLGAQLYKRGVDVAVRQTEKTHRNVPKAAAWIDYATPEGQAYWEALQYVSRWTRANHEAIHGLFLQNSGTSKLTRFGNEHNFVWVKPKVGNEGPGQPDPTSTDNIFLHGKGATPAWRDGLGRPLLGLIPLNMSAEILIVLGADNQEFLSFAPHGAGRNLSRSELVRSLGFRDDQGNLLETKVRKAIEDSTKGLDIRWFSGRPDVSESPLGYKNAQAVKAQIEHFGLAQVVAEIRPLGCIMAGDQPKFWELAKQSKKQGRQIQHRAERRSVKADLRNYDGTDIEE